MFRMGDHYGVAGFAQIFNPELTDLMLADLPELDDTVIVMLISFFTLVFNTFIKYS